MSIHSDEQQMLAEMSRRVAAEFRAGLQAIDDQPVDDAFWNTLSGLGLTGLLAPEEFGGVNASAVDLMLVATGFGAARCIDAFLPTSVLGVDIIRGAEPALREHLLPQVIAGSLKIAVTPPAGLTAQSDGGFNAIRIGTGFRVTGRQAVVLGADAANIFVILAQLGAEDEPVLLLVDRNAPGVSVNSYALIDGRGAGDVTLDQVTLGATSVLAEAGAVQRLEDAFDLATVAVMGEALGALEAILAATIEFLRTRHQFGRPLALFQVLRHRLADMYMAIEEVRSMTWAAAAAFDERDRAARQRTISQAKIHLNSQAVHVAEQGVQLHGAMGVTEEAAVGRHLQQITVITRMFGSTDYHLDRLERHRVHMSETSHENA